MLESPLVQKLIELALLEDLAFGDVTSACCIDENHESKAVLLAKDDMVVCGLPLLSRISEVAARENGFPRLSWKLLVAEGDVVASPKPLAECRGNTRALLGLERTILNFLQRMSGVATRSRAFVREAEPLVVLDTRKTIPGWRLLDKYASLLGGAKSHRLCLGDMVLVKNNHVDAQVGATRADRMRAALQRVRDRKGFYTPIEVEVREKDELLSALKFSPEVVMLDNMTDEGLQEALSLIKEFGQAAIAKGAYRAPLVEVSGGLTLERLPRLKALGIDCLSAGSITTQAGSVDISLSIESV
jgi:nicotinate-nucleotide pyrophosphorylase (carboxylating)